MDIVCCVMLAQHHRAVSTDHLGNVRATVSDMLMPRGSGVFDADLRTLTDYYPFGMTIPERSYAAAGVNSHRYGYGGHEKVDEVSGDANMVDMGDRWLDVRLGRTPRIDAHASKYPSTSPYSYVLNNPILFVDLDGKDVYFHISARPVGYTRIRLIGSEGVKGAPRAIEVPIYRMTVTDDVTGKTSSYLVTRDAPVINSSDPVNRANPILEFFGLDETTFNVQNTAFEPKAQKGYYKAVGLEYPSGMGAYALRNLSGGENLKAEDTPLRSGDAQGVMIHVGGVYQASDGTTRVTGSLGCFTLCGEDQGNAGVKRLVDDVYSRLQANRKAGKGTDINVTIDKRKDVDWESEADVSGKKK